MKIFLFADVNVAVNDSNSVCKPELEKSNDCCEESSGEESDTSGDIFFCLT